MERQKHQQTLQQELEGMEIEPVSSTWEYYTQQKEEVSFIYWCNIYIDLYVYSVVPSWKPLYTTT